MKKRLNEVGIFLQFVNSYWSLKATITRDVILNTASIGRSPGPGASDTANNGR